MNKNTPISWAKVVTNVKPVVPQTPTKFGYNGTQNSTSHIPKIVSYDRPYLCEYCEITKPYTHKVPTIPSYKNVSPETSNPFLEAIFEKIDFQTVIDGYYQTQNYKPVYKVTVDQNPYEIAFQDIKRLENIVEVHLTQTFQHNENGRLINFSKRKVKIGFQCAH